MGMPETFVTGCCQRPHCKPAGVEAGDLSVRRLDGARRIPDRYSAGKVAARAARGAALALLSAVLVTGCAAHVVGKPRRGTGELAMDPNEIVRDIRARRAEIHSVRAVARMAYHTAETSHRIRQVIVAERPDRLRWEVLSPFGTAFVLTANNGMIAAYAPGEDKLYRGVASPENLARYASVDLSVPTVVNLLLGTPPLAPGGLLVVSRDGEDLKLWQDLDDRVSTYWFNALLDPVRFERQDEEGNVLLSATFGDPVQIGAIRLPTHLTFEVPASDQRIDIELRDPEVNPDLPDNLFVLRTPSGVKEVDIDEVTN
jgi:outer membrane lipoprotein-sorting protein